jgi:nucleotide-binding universal stress UspA family protein
VNARSYVPPGVGSIISRVARRFKRRSCPVYPTPEAERRSNHSELETGTDSKDRPRSSEQPPKRTLNRILVPTDFSPSSAQALDHALSLAAQSHASITLLHIINVNPPDSAHWAGSAATLMERLWTEGFAQMGRLAWSLAGRNVEPRTIIEEGLPWERIVEKSDNADLIVLGKHPSRRWNFFSHHTVERVITDAKCPVVVVSAQDSLLVHC